MKRLINYMFLLLAVAGVASLASCKPNRGTPPLKKKEMIDLMVDVHVTQALMNRQNTIPSGELQKNRFYKSVLDKHNITEEQFDSAVAWYSRNANEYKAVYKAVIDTLEKRRNRL
ncbi:MAG: DUF4296 domain-containing protein [Paludibacteraceae bacterium]|nr:DUF4296 domain-containing protein [Paludibacteraceae bacterium]